MDNATFPIAIRHLGAAACLAALLGAAEARAEVMEIDARGMTSLRTESGAVEWTNPGVSPAPPFDQPDLPDAVLTRVESLPVPAAFAPALVRAADFSGISPALLEALVWRESRWHPAAVSSAGAIGLGQLMPGTARQLGVNPRDPDANLMGAARYLRQQLDRFDNDIERALAAYNAGPKRIQQAGGVPNIAETRDYVAAITARLSASVRIP